MKARTSRVRRDCEVLFSSGAGVDRSRRHSRVRFRVDGAGGRCRNVHRVHLRRGRPPTALRFANGLLRQKKFELAAQEYERILKAGATGAERDDARFGLGSAWLSMGRYREARGAFDDFLKGAPNDPRAVSARFRLGELSYLLGDLPAAREALEAFTSAKTDHPSLELAWTYLGDTCFGLDDLPGAKVAYERSLAAYPQGRTADRARYGLARTLAASGERDRALSLLDELVKKGSPEWVDRCWLQIGLIRESAGRLAEAVEAFSTLERVAPASRLRPEAQLHRGVALAGLGRAGEAAAATAAAGCERAGIDRTSRGARAGDDPARGPAF